MTESYLCETNPEFEKMLQKFVGGADISKRRMRSHNKKAIYKSKMKKKFNRVDDDNTVYSSYYPIYMEYGTSKNPRKNPYPQRYWTGNRWFKNYSNRKIRRNNKDEFYGKGNHYRKEFDYKWTIE